ncbi:DUF4440 domain-containing protein [Shewanella sp. VB17]|uniref:YybH family protein n=1 Tax=Shewanella sp. VB17 TaxID=2739432 RepID=UPI001566590D|nr:DUF4440 domain-containing protein [Shewanella sp. VB17]NRD71726.1 DUF4440 domain-containing protein [Shewanella sp. VB17]
MIKNGIITALMLITFSVSAIPSDDITQVLMDQQDAWNSGDLDGYMQGYWNSEKMGFVSGDKLRYGWKETLAAYKKNYPDKASLGTLQFTIKEIRMLSNDAGMVIGRWQLTRTKDQPSGIFTLLVEKFDGRWVITHDHTSD